ncbi:hypothetical protein E3J79_01315 [Candidatus Dependentiae bacterium]|nr:MAG: hypothetical protein E3J79_01315 [Candidatus Dependentiae bacterium]
MKYTRSLITTIAVFVCFSQALRGMAPPTLPGNFEKLPPYVQKDIISKLSDRDLARLAQTSKQASKVLEDALAQRHLQATIELSLWESRIKIDFSSRIRNYPSLDQFKQEVLNTLAKTAKKYPEQWISLDLGDNNLGSLSNKELKEFFQSIAKYNVVELFLFSNQLTSLPENIFNNLHNLRILWLCNNQLTSLPEKIFNNLHNLRELFLYDNQLTSLPEKIFNNLHKLQMLELYDNQLTSLPEKIFNNLHKLQMLELCNNQLTSLPEKIFNNLHNLRELFLYDNQLTSLPEKIFNNLPNLRKLSLYDNRLNSLPENIFNNLHNLQWLNLSFNQLTYLPEKIFNQLLKLRELNLSYNQLRDTEKQSIRRKLTNIKIIF